jgi:hypothetical protein
MNVFLLFVILAVVVAAYYAWSLHRYPQVSCRWCKGRKLRDPVYRKAFGKCAHWGRKGWKDRCDTRLVGRRSR